MILDRINNWVFTKKQLLWIQLGVIILFSFLPLFFSFPFKINLYLAWEGAYRMSLGQVPYADFSLPMGFGFWIIPAIFFKIFGPSLYTLIIAQAFINLVSLLALRRIFSYLGLSDAKVFLSLLVYCFSFVFVNFWPWYNHSVFFFQVLNILFFLEFINSEKAWKKYAYLALSAFFVTLSFFTKQDGGGLAIVMSLIFMGYWGIINRDFKAPGIYVLAIVLFFLVFILPFLPYDFNYWFNYGQEPHYSRISTDDLFKDIFQFSPWLKFYLLAAVVLAMIKFKNLKSILNDQKETLFFLLTIGIIFQAMIIQVTSYIPHNSHYYFHTFAFAYLVHFIPTEFKLARVTHLTFISLLVFLWWSSDFYRYGKRILVKVFPESFTSQPRDINKISKYTWKLETAETEPVNISPWIKSDLRTFNHVQLPKATIEGIDRLLDLEVIKEKGRELKVLNMSELTPLASEIGYTPVTGIPLWFHKNVAIFDREVELLCNQIEKGDYDLILFQTIPYLNDFFSNEAGACAGKHYEQVDRFLAPRQIQDSYIEVYVRKK